MPQVINTNISALNAQRNLNKSQMTGQQAMQRLSSGLRINSAKDDSAGSAIASRMSAQINGLTQAARNANDGISLAQTAEGTLSEISNSLQRIRELALQSANATNSASDRASLDAESTQLVAEITRQASQAQFNGINLLDGSFLAKDFQVGANANQTITINSIADSRATGLGSNTLTAAGSAMSATTVAATDITGGNGVVAQTAMTINTTNGGTTAPFTIAAKADAKAIAAAINAAASSVGVTATATNSAVLTGLSSAGTIGFTLGGTGSQAISAVVADPTDLTALVAAINGAAGTTKITATFTTTSAKDSITLTSSDGSDISILNYADSVTAGAQTASFGKTGTVVTLTEGVGDSAIKTGSVALASTKGLTTLGGGAQATVFNTMTSAFASVASISLTGTDGTNAQLAIATVDAALAQINSSRGDLGAVQNRFSSTVNNLQSTSENLSASRSRIQDADFAAESAELSRSQVLQQAGTAMLAQANQSSSGVMALLR